MPFVILCDRCDYIKCWPCPGQDGDPPDYYIRSVNLSEQSGPVTFKVDEFCYTVDPDDPQGLLPQGALELSGVGTTFDDCADCTADPDDGPPGGERPPPGGGPPGGDGGGGGGDGGGGGGGYPTPFPPPIPKGFLATPCPGQTGALTNLWIDYVTGDAVGNFIIRYEDYCYEVDTTGTPTNIPNGAIHITISGTYEDCEHCIGGIPLTICGDQYVGTVPDYYIRKSQIPATPRFVRIDGVCFTVNPDLPVVPIPPNAVLVNPQAEYASCDDCIQGVLAELCLREVGSELVPQKRADEAPEVWVPVGWLPNVGSVGSEGVVIFRYKGWCYSLDPEAETSPKPADADVVHPVAEYPDCPNCICGARIEDRELGVKAQRCSRNTSPDDLWVPASALPVVEPPTTLNPCPQTAPEDIIYFLHDGNCWWLDPNGRQQMIPVGATVIGLPTKQYETCFECIAANQPERIKGYPATPCPGETGPEIWVLDEGYPEHTTYYFSHGGACYSFNTDSLQVIPDGVSASSFFDSCVACSEGDGGGGGDPDPPPGDDEDDDDDSNYSGLEVWTCAGDGSDGVGGGEPAGMCVQKAQGLAGKILLIGDTCYRVTAIEVNCGGPLAFDQVYSLCTTCVADQKCYRLYKCSDESASDLYISIFKWSQNGGDGLPVMKVDGECYYADTSTKYDPAGRTLVNPSADQRYETCEECEQNLCDIWSIKWNCTANEGAGGWQDFVKIQSSVPCDEIEGLAGFDEWVYIGIGDDDLCEYRAKSVAGSPGPFIPLDHSACPCAPCECPPGLPTNWRIEFDLQFKVCNEDPPGSGEYPATPPVNGCTGNGKHIVVTETIVDPEDPCHFQATEWTDSEGGEGCSPTQIDIWHVPGSPCGWEVRIVGILSFFFLYKFTGNSPAGNYGDSDWAGGDPTQPCNVNASPREQVRNVVVSEAPDPP